MKTTLLISILQCSTVHSHTSQPLSTSTGAIPHNFFYPYLGKTCPDTFPDVVVYLVFQNLRHFSFFVALSLISLISTLCQPSNSLQFHTLKRKTQQRQDGKRDLLQCKVQRWSIWISVCIRLISTHRQAHRQTHNVHALLPFASKHACMHACMSTVTLSSPPSPYVAT